MNSLEPSNSFI